MHNTSMQRIASPALSPKIVVIEVGRSWFWEVRDEWTGTLLTWADRLYPSNADAVFAAEDAWRPLCHGRSTVGPKASHQQP
jgi:hypothetical protein